MSGLWPLNRGLICGQTPAYFFTALYSFNRRRRSTSPTFFRIIFYLTAMSTWMCPSCPKSFSRKGDLTRHQLLHTGIKPHKCEMCGKGFAQYSGLKTHRNTHTKAKPYVCGIGTCMKAFSDPSSCTRHRKETHRREGAYKCIVPECGTRIKRRSAFVAHMKKHDIDVRALDMDAIVSSANKSNSKESFHFLPPYIPDTPYCPPSKTGMEPAIANCTVAPAPTPMSNYQIPVPQYGYGGNSDVDGMYDYSWPSVLGAGRPISSLSSMPSMSTFPPAHIGNYLGNVFDNGYNGYLQSDDMFSQLPPPYPSVPSPLPPLLDDSMDSRLRSLSSSPASSSRSALDDPLDFAFLGHNVPHQYLLLSTT
ncbi:hypothetical protein M405DRAFT_780103, partial [Rhizopogon salebrosus TDB-379]